MTRSIAPGGLDAAFESPAAKRRHVRALFATIADRYDVITRLLSFGADQRWKRRAMGLADIRRGERVLDLACGTGDFSILAAARGAQVVGIDITPGMLHLAQAKPAARGVLWAAGDMNDLPVASGLFRVVLTGYGLRNVPDLDRAIREAHRVLGPGGRLCSLDFDRPANGMIRRVYLTYLTIIGATLGWLLHRDPDTYRYIPESIRRYPGARQVAQLMHDRGFREVRHVPVLGGLMAIHVATK